MRLVLDTNIVITALLWLGAPHQLLGLITEGRASCFSSAELIGELARALQYPKFAQRISERRLTAEALVERYARLVSRRPVRFYRRIASPTDTVYRRRRKPEWVRQEVIRLKALMRESGTLKEKLDQLAVDSFEALNLALGEFRFFYNHGKTLKNRHTLGANSLGGQADRTP